MRWPILILAVLASLAALVSAQDYVEARQSACWTCHTPADEFPMGDGFGVGMAATNLTGSTTLRPVISDPWPAELSGVTLALALRDAPDLSFLGDRDPEDWSQSATIEVDATDVEGTQTALTRRHTVQVPFHLEDGASGIQVRLQPVPSSTADVRLAIYAAAAERPFVTLDNGGPGEPERFSLDEGAAISQVPGPWRLEASIQAVDSGSQRFDPQATDVHVEFSATTWFNASTERISSRSVGNLSFGEARAVPFAVQGTPDGGWVELSARAHLYYEHKTNTGDDEAFILAKKAFPIQAGVVGDTEPHITVPTPAKGISTAQVSEVIGYAAGLLMLASMVSGGIFGKASRRGMNRIFFGARRRIAFHNFLSYGIILAAMIHLALFLAEQEYRWTAGILWGGAGIMMLLLLGVTGALQVPMIRRWSYGTWRWIHFGCAIAAVALTLAHVMLDGAHFGAVRDVLGYQDPFSPAT